MNAPEILAEIGRRGATARAELDDDGTAVLVVAPRAVVGDLLPDLQRFKPQLIELLSVSTKTFIGGHREEETGQISPRAPLVDTECQKDVSGPLRRFIAVPDVDELERFAGVQLTDRHFDVWAQLQCDRLDLDEDELLDWFAAGLLPDDGGAVAVWRAPDDLADELQVQIVDWCAQARRD